MPKVHIVIPMYNNWELTHNLLWSLYRKERENIESILVMDDVSTDTDVVGGLNWWRAGWREKTDPLKIRSITNEENLGFTLNSNKGLQEISKIADPSDVVILLSNDVQINAKFISQIVSIVEETPKVLVGGIAYLSSTGWNNFGDTVFPYLEGWLLATTVENWKELDYFDPRYAPHCMEDVDLSTKALKLGYQLVPLNNVGLVHLAGRTIKYTDERHEQTRINKDKFEEKWLSSN